MSEKILVDKILKNDHRSIEVFYNDFLPSIRILISRYARNSTESEDLFHDVFVHLLDSLKKFEFRCSLKTFIYRVSINFLNNYGRKRKQENTVFLHSETADTNIEEEIIKKEQRFEMSESFNRLSEEDKLLLIMKIILSLPYTELENIYELPADTLKMRVSRAKKKLYREWHTTTQKGG